MNKIVFVDDNLFFIKNLYNVISKNCNNLVCKAIATSSSEAIKYVQQYVPDIILLDLEMPKGNGFQVIDYIKNSNMSTKIIIVSAYCEKIYNSEYSKMVDAIVPKPVLPNSLIKIINNFLVNMEDLKIKNYIIKELNRFQFNTQTSGFHYLIESIFIAIQSNKSRLNLEKEIYVQVSKMHRNTSSHRIKWCIDKTIRNMYSVTKPTSIFKDYFHISAEVKPTAKLIITTLFENYYNL